MSGLHLAQKWNATFDTKLPTSTNHNILHDLFQEKFTHSTELCTQIHELNTFPNTNDIMPAPLTDWIKDCYASKTQNKCATVRLHQEFTPTSTISGIAQMRSIVRHKKINWKNNDVQIGVHIRRGDLHGFIALHKPKDRAAASSIRLLPNNLYIKLINDCLNSIRREGNHTNITLNILAENSEHNAVPDVTPGKYTNFHRVAQQMNWKNTNIVVHGHNHPDRAFHTMCQSDILITGTSGFSHLAALLCDKPLVLAIPFWLTYDCIPKAIYLLKANTSVYSLGNNLGNYRLTSHMHLPCRLLLNSSGPFCDF